MARVGTRKSLVLCTRRTTGKIADPFSKVSTRQHITTETIKTSLLQRGRHARRSEELLADLNKMPFILDLPAVGLAYGYFNNFIYPLYNSLRRRKCTEFTDSDQCWELDYGFTITGTNA